MKFNIKLPNSKIKLPIKHVSELAVGFRGKSPDGASYVVKLCKCGRKYAFFKGAGKLCAECMFKEFVK